jgi:hypothetical protein
MISLVRYVRLIPALFDLPNAEDAEAEADVIGEDSVQSADPENSLLDVANEVEQGAVTHDDRDDLETATRVLPTRVGSSEVINTYEEDEEDPESWELDDGYAAWEETVDSDDLGAAPLVEEVDAESTGSSTLSERTASLASKRSFTEIDEPESPVEPSSSQS